MRKILLALLLCVLLANTAWGVLEVRCSTDARMDTMICNVFGTNDGRVGFGFTVRGANGMIVAYGPELVLDRHHEHVIRVDQHRALRSHEVEERMAIFYDGLNGTDDWNRIARVFSQGEQARLRLYLWPQGQHEGTVSLAGFTQAYGTFRKRVRAFIGDNLDTPESYPLRVLL